MKIHSCSYYKFFFKQRINFSPKPEVVEKILNNYFSSNNFEMKCKNLSNNNVINNFMENYDLDRAIMKKVLKIFQK